MPADAPECDARRLAIGCVTRGSNRRTIALEGVEMFNDSGRVAFKKREGSEVETETDAWLLATAADPERRWLASTERIACLDEQGTVLAEIPSQTFYRDVVVSRDFGRVVRIDRAGNTTRLFGYTVTAPCTRSRWSATRFPLRASL